MTQTKEILFNENKIMNRGAMRPSKILSCREDIAKLSPIAANRAKVSAGDSIIYFDIAADDCAPKSAAPAETKNKYTGFSADTIESETLRPAALQESFRQSARLSSFIKKEPKRLFDILLACLDRMICLDEMAENLKKLDAAVEAENVKEITSIAYECADVSAECGMLAAIEPLLELERVENENQMTKAAALSAQIRKEFENCRLALEEKLERLSAIKNSTAIFPYE